MLAAQGRSFAGLERSCPVLFFFSGGGGGGGGVSLKILPVVLCRHVFFVHIGLKGLDV